MSALAVRGFLVLWLRTAIARYTLKFKHTDFMRLKSADNQAGLWTFSAGHELGEP